jgi:O-antigen/teichoic acid export membrane protein
MLLSGLVIGLVLLLTGDFLFSKIFDDRPISFYPYGLLSVATGIFQSIFKVYSSFLQTRERPELFFRINVICFTLVAVATLGGLYYFPQTLTGPVAGRTVAFGVSAIWVFILIAREFGLHFNYSVLRSSFDFNRSSFLYQLQVWSINYFDRFLMVFFLPLPVIGVYDFAMKCMMALDFIIGGLYNSFYPKVISIMRGMDEKKSTPEVNRYYHGLIGVIMLLVCGSIVFFSMVIDAGLIGKGYEESIAYFPWIGIYYLIRSIRYYFAFPIGILKFSKPLPVIYLIISVSRIGVILLLMPYGIYAVVVSAIFSNGLEIVLLWLFIKQKFDYRFNVFKIIFTPLLLSVFIGLSVQLEMSSMWMYLAYPIVCLSLLWWVYRKELRLLNFSKYLG